MFVAIFLNFVVVVAVKDTRKTKQVEKVINAFYQWFKCGYVKELLKENFIEQKITSPYTRSDNRDHQPL